jgi:hypothetical protein
MGPSRGGTATGCHLDMITVLRFTHPVNLPGWADTCLVDLPAGDFQSRVQRYSTFVGLSGLHRLPGRFR